MNASSEIKQMGMILKEWTTLWIFYLIESSVVSSMCVEQVNARILPMTSRFFASLITFIS